MLLFLIDECRGVNVYQIILADANLSVFVQILHLSPLPFLTHG